MKWKQRWGYTVSSKPVETGIYRLKEGGFVLRARVTDRAGKLVPIFETAHHLTSVSEAVRRRLDLIEDARAEARGVGRPKQLWSDFAASLLEERVAKRSIESVATTEWWQDTLEDYLIPAFGNMRAVDVTRHHIETWLTKTVLPWMRDGKLIQRRRKTTGAAYGPPYRVMLKAVTVNGYLRILSTISNAIKVKFDLAKSAFDGIEFLPEGRTYSKEEPNALAPDTVQRFLAIARAMYPQHFFMMLLGFVTGLRPSSMRPLRRCGPQADLDWVTGELIVRRSNSRGTAVMDRTKTKVDNTFTLPPALLEEARLHVAGLTGAMLESDLLFPNDKGTFRSRTVLDKPFKAVRNKAGIHHRVTPRAMRRTFQDLAREVGLDNVITRSISGHQTDEMRVHYSTAQSREQSEGLARVTKTALRGEHG